MALSATKIKRPKRITAICIHGWAMVIISFIYGFSPTVKKMGEFYPILYTFVACFFFIAFVGIWNMKRWGVNLLVISFFARNILLVLMNDMSYKNEFFNYLVISIIFLIFYYRKMDVNL